MTDTLTELKIIKNDLGHHLEEAYIVPLGDLHIGSNFDEDLFLKYRQWILDRPNAYCVINGDVCEMVTKNSVGDVYEALRPKQQKELALKFLRPLAEQGRILAYIDGNHEHRMSNETDEYVGEYICNMLGIPSVYSPDGAYMFTTIGYKRKEGKKNRIVYTLYIRHGNSGAKQIGGKAKQLQDMAGTVEADIYIVGHTHQQLMFPEPRTVPDTASRTLVCKNQKFVSSGAFLKWGGYAQRKGYNPVTLGSPVITLSGEDKAAQVTIY